MGLKEIKIELTQEQDIYYELLGRYEKALYENGWSEEEVNREVGEFILLGGVFKGK